MPDRLHSLQNGSNDGNPTKCAEVNDFVKYLKKLEARKQGANSETRQPTIEAEFCQLHQIFKTYGGPQSSGIWRYGMPALMNYQFHMCTTLYRASISNSIQYTLLLVSNTTLVHWPCTVLGYTGRLVIQ